MLKEEPHPVAFLRMYNLCKNKDCSFYISPTREGHTLKMISNCYGWKDSFFFFGSHTPWECQTHFVPSVTKLAVLPEEDELIKCIIEKVQLVKNPHPWKYPKGPLIV